jgi:predicted nucleotidyltransferase component of viral defense system
MAKIPLNLMLKKRTEKEVAYAQDIIVGELYKSFPYAVLHGGTAIWRCYQGNRFSEDVDVYIPRDVDKIKALFKSFETRGFKITKSRIKENAVYAELIFNNVSTRFEATFQNKKFIPKLYETSESFFINVYTLSPEQLVLEKVETYLKRLKIRDLYDIYFLLNIIENKAEIEGPIKRLIKDYKKPNDEENLSNIIIVGAILGSDQLLIEIKKWVK